MSLKHAVLAALLEGESSGYDLAKIFDVSVANFWAATPQQLYRELERLAEGGLVAARVVQQERRPNKRLFRLTEAGLTELHAFTAAEPRPTAIRDELMVQIQAVDVGDAEAVKASVEKHVDRTRQRLARFGRLREHMLAGRNEATYLREAERVGPYLTLTRGLSFEQENLRWGEQVLVVLAARSGNEHQGE